MPSTSELLAHWYYIPYLFLGGLMLYLAICLIFARLQAPKEPSEPVLKFDSQTVSWGLWDGTRRIKFWEGRQKPERKRITKFLCAVGRRPNFKVEEA